MINMSQGTLKCVKSAFLRKFSITESELSIKASKEGVKCAKS